MPKLTVDGVEVEVPAGATVLQACEAAGAEIPRFCYHERLSIAGNCRMCLVDVSPGPPKPQASCALPAADGQVVSTTSARTKKAQQGAMEFLLINHPLDCPICDQGGECDLQDQALAYGRGHTRYHENKRAVTEKYMGPLIKTVMTRCIHCTRCVRFAEEVAGVEDIGAIGRGENMQITSYLEGAVRSELSGNVIDLCPVGALTSKPYAFEARPWELKKTESIDVMDAVGTNIVVATRGTAVMRVTPRINDDVNEEWASDVTRFAVDGLQRGRLDAPYVRVGGKLTKTTWAAAFDAVRGVLAGVAGEDVAAVAGDLADVEAMVALKDLLGQLGSTRHECRVDGMVTAGAHPSHYRLNSGLTGIETADVVVIVGSDVRHEAPLVNTRIRKLRRAGRTVFNLGPAFDLTYPVVQLGNDAGLLAAVPEALADALGKAERPAVIVGSAVPADVLAAVMALVSQYNLVRDGWNGVNLLHTAASRVGALDIGFVSDGGMAALTEKPAKVLFNLGVDEVDVPGGFRIYLGHHGDRGARAADVILPAAAYTEKSGTYVNLEGRVQRGLRATFPPGEAREDWTILRALSAIVGTPLPYDDLRALRARIAAEWPHLGQEGLTPVPWVASEPVETAAPSGPIEVPVRDFYRPNAIARASATMAACVAEIVDADEPALEAAE